jgi:hypothetical protein
MGLIPLSDNKAHTLAASTLRGMLVQGRHFPPAGHRKHSHVVVFIIWSQQEH